MARIICALAALAALCGSTPAEQILFESGTLGPTSVVPSPESPTANINQSSYNGVRLELTNSVITSSIGGHFVGTGTFFGAIIRLTDDDDFPDSEDLSTPDVLGYALIGFDDPSREIFSNLSLTLTPGHYALVFGSGLFESNGFGGALLNNPNIGDPEYIGLQAGSDWGNLLNPLFNDYRFVLKGAIVPEPTNLVLALTALAYGTLSLKRNTIY